MRLAGSPKVYEALVKHFSSDCVPEDAANHLAAEVMTHGGEVNTRIDDFFRLYESLLSKGFSEDAAQHLAVEMMEGREPMAKESIRFARVHGEETSPAEESDYAD